MAEGALIGILGKIGEYLVAPVGRQFRYLCCYNTMVEHMRDEIQDLENLRAGEQLRIDAARRNVEDINPVVEAWLTRIEEIKTQSSLILEDKSLNGNGCFNLKSRYLLGKKLTEIIMEVEKVKGKCKFDWVSCPKASSSTLMLMPPTKFTTFDSRLATMNTIIEALKDDEVDLVGVCGMGGVGKTTMVHQISQRVRSDNLFSEVVMTVVSQNQDVFKIQAKLGAVLGLRFDEGTDVLARANKLCMRLQKSQNRDRVLVILDDVWDGIDLVQLGVPLSKGCKVLLTSRIEDVCVEIGTQKKDIFTVSALTGQEAWVLFKEKAGHCVDDPDLHLIAKEIARECCGLPIAIVTVAVTLKDKDKHAWNDALHQLKNSSVQHIRGMHKKVFSCIELSYEYLESEQAKLLFLLCCVFPEDHGIPIEILVRYVAGLGLFKDLDTLLTTRNRVCALAGELRGCHLLLSEARFQDQFVKMHDVVRDVGISIALRKGNVYKVRQDPGLKEWLQDHKHEFYNSLSIISGELLELPSDRHFPKLEILQLDCILNRQELRGTFGVMEELKVIDIRNMHILSLAQSFSFSLNLRTLCLDSCKVGNDLSFLGSLKYLEILTFFLSELEVLPSEIGQLGNLKLLDLRCFRGPVMIPFGVLSGLKKLEELYMGYYFAHTEELDNIKCASVRELKLLSRLSTLQIKIPKDPGYLVKLNDFKFENLVSFDFEMRDKPPFIGYQFSNKVSLSEVNLSVVLKSNISLLVKRAEVLDFKGVNGFKNVVMTLDKGGKFVDLKMLYMTKCNEVEYVVDTIDSAPFEKLQKLTLYSLPSMKSSWRGPVQTPSLRNLIDIEICECNAMKSIFCKNVVKCLVKLLSLAIADCEMLEEVVSREDSDGQVIEFPKLEELYLKKLPKLTIFYPGDGTYKTLLNQQVMLPSLEDLEITHLKTVNFVGGPIQVGLLRKLRTFRIEHCENLSNVASSHHIKLYENLHRLSVAYCASLEAVFDFEGIKLAEQPTKFILNCLESMKLCNLPKLMHIFRTVPKQIQGFQVLRSLIVEKCNNLKYVLSPFMAELLVNLEEISVKKCEMMKEIVNDQEEERLVNVIVFYKIRTLNLEGLNSLVAFNTGKHAFEFPLLEELVIKNCHSMKFFSSESIETPMLEGVMVRDDQLVLMGNLNDIICTSMVPVT